MRPLPWPLRRNRGARCSDPPHRAACGTSVTPDKASGDPRSPRKEAHRLSEDCEVQVSRSDRHRDHGASYARVLRRRPAGLVSATRRGLCGAPRAVKQRIGEIRRSGDGSRKHGPKRRRRTGATRHCFGWVRCGHFFAAHAACLRPMALVCQMPELAAEEATGMKWRCSTVQGHAPIRPVVRCTDTPICQPMR